MTFGMLKILAWIAIYLSILELGLELRAYYRGFDTILFGSYQRPTQVAKEKATPLRATLSLPSEGGVEPHQRDPGVIRYWIASSSQAEDVYLSHDLIFPTRLENLLRDSGIPAAVVNASHAGMDINANRIDLETRGPEWKPDVVILYQMSNTISDLSKRLLSNARSSPGRLDKIQEEGVKPRADWTVRLIEQTAIYSQLKGHVTSRLATKRVLSDTIGERGDAEFEAMVHDFIRTSRRIGATTVLCTFATSHVRKDLPNFPNTAIT